MHNIHRHHFPDLFESKCNSHNWCYLTFSVQITPTFFWSCLFSHVARADIPEKVLFWTCGRQSDFDPAPLIDLFTFQRIHKICCNPCNYRLSESCIFIGLTVYFLTAVAYVRFPRSSWCNLQKTPEITPITRSVIIRCQVLKSVNCK